MKFSFERLAFDWPISVRHGWGVYGKNLALRLLLDHGIKPVLLGEIEGEADLDPIELSQIKPHTLKTALGIEFPDNDGRRPRLTALDRNLYPESSNVEMGGWEIGVGFWEEFDREMDAAYANTHFLGVVAGSNWNAERLREIGVANVRTVLQGVDLGLFHAAPSRGIFRDRFVIFSGGKLEYRKGQDIVVRAFAEFAEKHRDALLVTSWSNMWSESAKSINQSELTAPLRVGIPSPIETWMLENGIPQNQMFNLPMMPNHFMPQVLRDCDLAVFPNRCEGGTNLVAMEAMACGVPTILSANTGHLHFTDVMDPEMVLGGMAEANPSRVGWSVVDWRDLVECMEREYKRRRPGGVYSVIHHLTWKNQVEELLLTVRDLIA